MARHAETVPKDIAIVSPPRTIMRLPKPEANPNSIQTELGFKLLYRNT